MMESADLWELDHLSQLRRLHGSRLGAVHVQGQVSTRPVVVAELGGQNPAEMSVVQDNDLVEVFAADAADKAFYEGRLSGAPGCDENLFETHVVHTAAEFATVNPIAVS